MHSHAFQRLLRGDVQRRDLSQRDTFWTWRERMYDLALGLDLDALEAAARLTYAECLESGYTAVGEFHYVHRDPSGQPYPDPVATSRAMLRAARQAGIRITLLWTVYASGGFDVPLSERQTRFGASSLD
ncbi:MAG: amidohydrolase family protein, partial [Myxococcota bacterium]|nr:amidohydrolase family protein [Myxococcota bacterium]